MRKLPSLLLIILLATSSLLLVNFASAQMQKPDVPEFTVSYADYSYNVQPQSTIDQYTGRNVTTDYGYRVDNRTVTFIIKNQPFTPYTDSSGNLIKLYYNIRYKGPYGNNWSYYPNTECYYGLYAGVFPDTSASRTPTTTIEIRLADLTSYSVGTPAIPYDAEIEFQVQAIEGYITVDCTGLLAGNFMDFAGERSDWSSTQTIFTEQNPQAPTPVPACSIDPSVVPMQQDNLAVTAPFDWKNLAIAVLTAALAASTSAALILKRKTSPHKTVEV